LSSRQKKAKGRKKPEPKKEVKAKPVRPTAKAPQAMVTSRHGTGFVTRLGRGFSMGELAGAGLSANLASNWGLRLDLRRRSVVDSNVGSLKNWSTHPGAARKTEGVVREVEEEIEKVGKEIKKEAVKVEKKAEKVEREVKEEAVKAEKTVSRKSRPKKKAES